MIPRLLFFCQKYIIARKFGYTNAPCLVVQGMYKFLLPLMSRRFLSPSNSVHFILDTLKTTNVILQLLIIGSHHKQTTNCNLVLLHISIVIIITSSKAFKLSLRICHFSPKDSQLRRNITTPILIYTILHSKDRHNGRCSTKISSQFLLWLLL